VLPVELHHLFIHLLLVALIFLLQLPEFWLDPLHLHHRFGALDGERSGQHHHQNGEKRYSDYVVGDKGVEERQYLREQPEEGVEDASYVARDARERGGLMHVQLLSVRHGISAVTAEGAAAANAADGQEAALEQPVSLE
jgi:hypothetical protein